MKVDTAQLDGGVTRPSPMRDSHAHESSPSMSTSAETDGLDLNRHSSSPPSLSPSGSPPPDAHPLDEVDASAKYLRICWHDLTGTTRARFVPLRRALSSMHANRHLGLTVSRAALGLTQTGQLVQGSCASGEYDLCPDWDSLRSGPRQGHVTVMAMFREKDGSPAAICPRTLLQRTLEQARTRELSFLVGFEIEFVLLRRAGPGDYRLLDRHVHAWCLADAVDDAATAAVLEDAVARLDAAGIHVEMFHAESAAGQYEIVLPKAPALQAVDAVLYARQVIACCAKAHGFKMTLHPKPEAAAPGTAAHVHLSIASAAGRQAQTYEPFYAGILEHLPAIVAFTCPNPVSYQRIRDGCWAGGTWVTWGTQNREATLRKIKDSHWELKSMDGLANPYLALAAILAAGLDGFTTGEQLRWKDCTVDPASLSGDERIRLGITEKLPVNLRDALEALRRDQKLCSLLGQDLVSRYWATKEAEMKLLDSMDASAQWQWIVARY